MISRPTLARTALLTVVTLVAFAGSSILCRLALRGGAIDPVSYTALRLASGALVLAPFVLRAAPLARTGVWSPRAAAALLVYVTGFSFAYVTLDTGTGALVLFGAVQVTMIGAGLGQGERPSPLRVTGIAAAVGGVVLLVLPGSTAPDPLGALSMAAAGIAWGLYSLKGRGVPDPKLATAANFALAAPAALLILVASVGLSAVSIHVTTAGVLLAVTSGAVTSGMGYVIWYAALPGHSATSAAVVQLAVPVIAAAAGVAFLDEQPTRRLAAAGVLTLGGVVLAVLAPDRPRPSAPLARHGAAGRG